MEMVIAKIAVEKTTADFDKLFDYVVPREWISLAQRGCRVVVPFGRANKRMQGLIFSVAEQTPATKLKAVVSVLDPVPVVTEQMYEMIAYLVEYTLCTYYEAVKTVLPLGLNVDVMQTYSITCDLETLDFSKFTPLERNLLEFLKSASKQMQINALLDYSAVPEKKKIVLSLIEKGIVKQDDILKKRVADKTVKMLRLSDHIDYSSVQFTKKQQPVIDFLGQIGFAMLKETCYYCGVTMAVIQNLINRGIVESYEHLVEQSYTAAREDYHLGDIHLSPKQQAAADGIQALYDLQEPAVALLYGITGSGKTQVYIKLIEYVVNQGRQVMMLVPEIALTPQMVSQFQTLFGNHVAVLHSGLSVAERLREWRRIQAQEARIVIGTRSAVFAPCERLGLVIMDEEGETSYKSDASPRYHAREVAKLRCKTNRAILVLGSATPSVESYFYAKSGRYHFFEIDERYSNAVLPQVTVVDMQNEEQQGNLSQFSTALQFRIRQNLEQKEQTILLLNRRGYNTFVTCMDCKTTLKCPNCDLPLTYHRANNLMMCHYCGHAQEVSYLCSQCGGHHVKFMGQGTQRIEDELTTLFPTARILRMDTDTTYSRYSYEKNFEAFARGEYDIMVGTQMIAKGLDFPNVTLVGVINADQGLYSNDFRSAQRVFSLLTQVVGRSGRSEKAGCAFIQTYTPDNDVICFAARQDYTGFYDFEIAFRKMMLYPPFCDICSVGFVSGEEALALAGAQRFLGCFEQVCENQTLPIKVMGIAPASVYKLSNRYRYRILIKCRYNHAFRQLLREALAACQKDPPLRRVTVFADVNGEIL